MCAGLMGNGEGLDRSSMHSNGHTHRLILLRDNILYLQFVTIILSGMDKTDMVFRVLSSLMYL